MGTGIRKMRDLCQEAEIAEPQFDFSEFFTITFRKLVLNRTEYIAQEAILTQTYLTTEKSSEKSSGKSSEKILKLLLTNSSISAREIASTIGITNRAVEKQIATLKSQGKLKRIGSRKGGHWEVVGKLD